VHRFVDKLGWKYRRELPSACTSLVSAEFTMGWYGPDLQAVDISKWAKVSINNAIVDEQIASR
jgi:hypothetical protein